MENIKIFIVVTINYVEYVHITFIFETYIKSNFEQIKKKFPLKMGSLNNDILIVNGKITTFYSILMVINNKKILLIKNIELLGY